MSEHNISTFLPEDIPVVAYFDYQPEEAQTLTYPGCGASVELNSVYMGGINIMPIINQNILGDLADKCMESMESDKS